MYGRGGESNSSVSCYYVRCVFHNFERVSFVYTSSTKKINVKENCWNLFRLRILASTNPTLIMISVSFFLNKFFCECLKYELFWCRTFVLVLLSVKGSVLQSVLMLLFTCELNIYEITLVQNLRWIFVRL